MKDLPPFWVISLGRAQDRRAFIRQAFEDLGVEFEIVEAVDGRALDAVQLDAYSEWRTLFRYGRGLERGMLGASMSHLRAYQRMVDDGVPEVVIFEDDAHPSRDMLEVLRHREVFPAGWQVVTLHSLFEWADHHPIGDRTIAGRYQICSYARTPMGAQAYVIKLSAAKRLLEVGYPICLPPDELLLRRRPAGLCVYGIEPSPIAHAQFVSEIRTNVAPSAKLSRAALPICQMVVLAGRIERRINRLRDRRRAGTGGRASR